MPISEKLLKEYRERRQKAMASGGEAKLKKRHDRGQMGARERLLAFFQEGSFMESGMLAGHDCNDFGMADLEMPADGVITGVGYIDGRPVAPSARTSWSGAVPWARSTPKRSVPS